MFIDLSQYGRLTIDPSKYLTTLVIRLDVPDNRPGCGVMAGKYDPFTNEEQNKFLPVYVNEDFDLKLFCLDRPNSNKRLNQMLKWHYSAIGWKNAVYIEVPYTYEISLLEISNNDGVSDWSVSVTGNDSNFTLCLPDYKPGFLSDK